MKNLFLLVCFLLGSLKILIAQDKEPEFGKVDLSDLTMKECSFERSASSMNLIKTAKTSLETAIHEEVPEATTEYRVRIKIFNQNGFSAASIKIPYISESRSTKITNIEAFIYNLDASGKIIREKVERKQIFKEKSKAKNAVNNIAFTFPSLQKGSVIEYRYTKIIKNSFSVEPWFFQDEVPTAFSKVIISVPTYIRVNCHFVTFQPVEKDSSYKENGGNFFDEHIFSYTVLNIPSFRIEPFMSSLADNLERVEFALSPRSYFQDVSEINNSKWHHYNSLLLRARHFGLQFDKPLENSDSLIESFKKIKGSENKIAAVYEYAKKNLEWNKELTFYCDSIEECWKNKSGSSGEMNILLLNLLRKAGVKCYPILVSTRENGMPDETFPRLSQFNSVDVATIDSNSLYILDCTQKGLSYNTPPLNVLNRKAFVVDPKLEKWAYINDKRILMKNAVFIRAVMDSSGNVTGESRLEFIGFAKSETLAEQKKNKEKTNKEETDLSGEAENLIIDTVIAEPNNENSDTLIERTLFHFTPSNTANSYFLNPFLFSYFKKNPFTDTARLYDVDFGCTQSYFMSLNLKVADNFSIEGLPKGISIRMQDSSILFRREIFQGNNELLIRNTFTINNSYFDKDNYSAVKSFFDKVYALINDQVLLKKK